MTLEECLAYVDEKYGKIFSIRFKKRTPPHEIREMVCRQGVKSHLVDNPSRPAVDFRANNLIAVFDMKKGAYRSIPIEGIIAIKIEGKWVEIQK